MIIFRSHLFKKTYFILDEDLQQTKKCPALNYCGNKGHPDKGPSRLGAIGTKVRMKIFLFNWNKKISINFSRFMPIKYNIFN